LYLTVSIWKGPEEDDGQGDYQLTEPIIDKVNEEPPLSGNEPENGIPFIIPSILVAITLIGIAGSLLVFRIETVRYKWTILLIPLYSKLKKSKIEKGIRFEILGYVKARPGANYSELKRNLDLNDGSLVHHLRVLEREEKIYSKKMGKYKLFYASSYKRKPVIEDYISPFHQRILQIISENPGIVPKKLSAMLDRSQTDISYHLSELSRNGYLERIKKGRNSHYYINNELMALLSS
jgi:predicted transcriptional regulator